MTIAITGATGSLGRLVIDELLSRVDADRVVALVRDTSKAADLAARGVQVRAFDYDRPDALAPALEGVDRLLLISGNAVGQRVPQHAAVIDAAKALKKAKATRPAVVALVNDSTPEFSDVLHPRVADALKEIGASLWTVELQTQAPPQNLPARERAALVGDVTGWSGGINRTVLSPQGLVKAFADIKQLFAR